MHVALKNFRVHAQTFFLRVQKKFRPQNVQLHVIMMMALAVKLIHLKLQHGMLHQEFIQNELFILTHFALQRTRRLAAASLVLLPDFLDKPMWTLKWNAHCDEADSFKNGEEQPELLLGWWEKLCNVSALWCDSR